MSLRYAMPMDFQLPTHASQTPEANEKSPLALPVHCKGKSFQLTLLEHMSVGKRLMDLGVNYLILRDHLMLQIPVSPTTQLRHDYIAISQHVDIELDVRDGSTRDVYLWDVRREIWHDFGDGGHFQGGADDDDEVDFVPIVVCETFGELIWKGLAEEGDVGLHDAGFWDVVIFLFRAVRAAFEFALTFLVHIMLGSLPFHSRRCLLFTNCS